MLRCTFYNDEVEFNYSIELREDSLTSLFLDEETLKKTDQFIKLNDDVEDWIKAEPDLFEPFEALSKFCNIPAESILHTFLIMIAFEDQKGHELLCGKLLKKDVFLKKFRKYQNLYNATDQVQNVIAPDILIHALGYILINRTGRDEFAVSPEIIPFIIDIEGVVPENFSEGPAGFDVDVPHPEFTTEQKNFFERFKFLKENFKKI
jgi:hypothetical protein